MAKLKRIVACLMFLALCSSGYCQLFSNEVYNRKSAYVEVFGTGLGATLNYEYLYKDYGVKQGIRGGAGYFVNFFEKNQPKIISGALEYVSFAGGRNHHVEWGIGGCYQYKYYKQTLQTQDIYITTVNNQTDTATYYRDHTYKYQRTGPAIVPRIGYRYESPDGGLVIRIAYTPVIYILNTEKESLDGSVYHKNSIPFATKFTWGGASIGFSFY